MTSRERRDPSSEPSDERSGKPSGKPSRKRSVVVAEPRGPARTLATAACVAWLMLMIAIPLRYYAGGDRYDERFAWRMFSAVRVANCRVQVTETRGGSGEVPVALLEVLPAPWFELLKRNRPAVIESFLRWRCETREGVREVRFRNECTDPSGAALPPVHRVIDCESGAIEERGQ